MVSVSRSALQVAFGEAHKIVGADPALGAWDLGAAPAMAWSEGDVWRLEVSLPAGATEFKVGAGRALTRSTHRLAGPTLTACWCACRGQCVKVAGGGHVEWEGGGNRLLQARRAAPHPARVCHPVVHTESVCCSGPVRSRGPADSKRA